MIVSILTHFNHTDLWLLNSL